MNKPRKHADLIIAWAGGSQIQEKLYNGVSETYVWIDQVLPRWIPEYEYRVKPREFEEDEYYPVTMIIKPSATNPPDPALYREGYFYMAGDAEAYHESSFVWIGEKLEINWPEENK